MTFDSPILATFTAACAVAAILIVRRQHLHLRLSSKLLGPSALILLTLAAGSPQVLRPVDGKVVILADFSDSTRGAAYRDGRLIEELSQHFDAKVIRFPETPAHVQTMYSPPDADAVILLSDGQFELPAHAPPTYPILDPELESAMDVSIQRLEYRNREIVAVVASNLDNATLTFSSNPSRSRVVSAGSTTISDSIPRNFDPLTARVESADLWPENNSLTIAPSPPLNVEKWWVGASPPDDSWRSKGGTDLPGELSQFLPASVIVWDSARIDDLSPAQDACLQQYVSELGGTLILLNLQRQPAYSPVSDAPPTPDRRWVILCDTSGSMAQRSGDATRLSRAADAITRLLPTLPANDPVDIGGFARDLSWWSTGKLAREMLEPNIVPPNLTAAGPTNLDAILRKLAQSPDTTLPSEFIILTDAETEFSSLDALIESLKSARTRVHLLQIGEVISPSFQQLIEQTGGLSIKAEVDWSLQLRELAAGAGRERTLRGDFRFSHAGNSFTVPELRESWIKEDAKAIASVQVEGRSLPIVAEWNLGGGKVIAIAAPARDFAAALAADSTQAPRDPRVQISIDSGEELRITVDARDSTGYLNGMIFTAQLGGAAKLQIPQTAPGRYHLTLPAPATPAILSIDQNGMRMDRLAVAGRYPREFANIGLNRNNLDRLAQRTGGKVIEADAWRHTSILRSERRHVTAPILALACLCLTLMLIQWKRGTFLA